MRTARQRLPVLLLAAIATTAVAGEDIRFSNPIVAERPGEKVVTMTATNHGDDKGTVFVTSGGTQYTAGTLKPGESATVILVETQGEGPVVVFQKR